MSIILENERLRVELHEWPGVRRYTHKPTGAVLRGSGPDGKWAVNGQAADWAEWQIEARQEADGLGAVFSLRLERPAVELSVRFRLEGNEVHVMLEADEGRSAGLERLSWLGQPLLACDEERFSFARTELRQRSWRLLPGGGRGLYDRHTVRERITDMAPDPGAVPTMHACLFDGELCAFVHTDYPVAPLTTELTASGRLPGRADACAIAPNTYQYRVRDKVMEPLRMSVVFLTDLNGDGQADECDYQLWLNRRLPDADPMYKQAIWYKIFCADPKRGVLTTFREALDIIRRLHGIADGVPQIVYLVGWQFEGHDTGYPSLNRLHPGLAERPERVQEELRELVRRAWEEYGCLVSFHLNVDDAYASSPDWKPELLSRDPDGSPRVWLDPGASGPAGEDARAYHLSHTKDVESGDVFRRLDEFLALVPAARTVHLDAFRNTNASWDGDSYIGPLEELVCGMKPILAYFKERGIDVSTEGQNGMPVEDAGLFSAYWHFSPSLLYHGKIVGGGSVDLNAAAWGRGCSIDADILYRGEPSRLEGDRFQSSDFLTQWERIVDILYLGSLLYRFYLQREMVEVREDEKTAFIRYADGVNVHIDKREDRLSVRWGRLVIAEDHDRFVPMDDRIYLYSRYGTEREWPLPDDWASDAAGLRAYRLTADGREPTDEFEVREGMLRVRLAPHSPVVLEKERRE